METKLFDRVMGVCICTILTCAAIVVVTLTLKTMVLVFNS